MLKYLVMGVKTLLNKKNCSKCNVVMPVYAWKYCEQCDPMKIKQKRLEISEIKSGMLSHLTFRCDRTKALQSDTLVYDENLDIIGYRSPAFKLKS